MVAAGAVEVVVVVADPKLKDGAAETAAVDAAGAVACALTVGAAFAASAVEVGAPKEKPNKK